MLVDKPWLVYDVGGSVRDRLLGLPVHDHDYVVVGAHPEQLLAAGYRAVGKDFPVFLHPISHEAYALARTERKIAKGYGGFSFYCSPEVTLEQDLARRDLTINAIAQDAQGNLIDPYHGQQDLESGILRHVSAAFVEDPVRLLRIARFAARFPNFVVADETQLLMQHMVSNGEVDALVAERVWQELSRALTEKKPSRFFEVLHGCGALAHLFPELLTGYLEALSNRSIYFLDAPLPSFNLSSIPFRYEGYIPQESTDRQGSQDLCTTVASHPNTKGTESIDNKHMNRSSRSANQDCEYRATPHSAGAVSCIEVSIEEKFALLVYLTLVNAKQAQAKQFMQRLRVSNKCVQLAEMILHYHIDIEEVVRLLNNVPIAVADRNFVDKNFADEGSANESIANTAQQLASKLITLFKLTDVYRRPQRFWAALRVLHYPKGFTDQAISQLKILLELVSDLPITALVQQYAGQREKIAAAIELQRVQTIKQALIS